jgi:hypothetical protein
MNNSIPTQMPLESSHDVLPGCNWQSVVAPSFRGSTARTPSTNWWVRSSAKQVVCPNTGEPRGFKHSLMHGKKVVMSGGGADSGRTFRAQAEFLNNHEHRTHNNSQSSPMVGED